MPVYLFSTATMASNEPELERPKPEPGYPKPGFVPRNPNPGLPLAKPGFDYFQKMGEILLNKLIFPKISGLGILSN